MSGWKEDKLDEDDLEYEDTLFDQYESPMTASPSERGFHPDFSVGMDFSTWQPQPCPHPPQPVLSGKGAEWTIYAGVGPDCMKRLGEFDLLLNLTGDTVFAGHIIPVPALKQWASPVRIPEIVLDWPDMGIVHLPREFWSALVNLLKEQKARMLVFCVGGHGRTGTAVASLMAVCGWSSADAIAWVRANYCGRAIETLEQEEYVRWIAGEVGSLEPPGLDRGQNSARLS